jgi:homoserine O-acetyltransferase
VKRVLWLFVLTVAAAFAQEQQFASLGDFRLESGEIIRDCRIGYRTFGKLDAAKSNAVLFPTWFTGTTKDLIEQVGPGKLVDSTIYYVIAVDALGNGVSSSPSNSSLQPHMRFPRFSIRDMVNSQHKLVTEVFGLKRLRAVLGISMGGMQTFQWTVSYPEFMARAVPVVGSPRLTSYDLLLWEAELRAIESDASWNNGEYTSVPGSMRTVADIHSLNLTTPQYRTAQTSPQEFPKFLAAMEEEAIRGFDANNWVRQLQAMMGHDVAAGGPLEQAAAKVRTRMLVVVGLQDHMVNPGPALAFAKAMKAPTLALATNCGHLAPGCEQEKVSRAVARFLQ